MTNLTETTKLTIVASKDLDDRLVRDVYFRLQYIRQEVGIDEMVLNAKFLVKSDVNEWVQVKVGRDVIENINPKTWEVMTKFLSFELVRENKASNVYELALDDKVDVEIINDEGDVNVCTVPMSKLIFGRKDDTRYLDILANTVHEKVLAEKQAAEKQRKANLESSLEIVAKLKELHPKFDTEFGYTLNKDNHIIRLWLSNLEMSELPSFVFELDYLKYIDLSNNELTSFIIPDGKFRNLEELILTHNHLSEVDNSVLEAIELRHVALNHNHIMELPEWLLNCVEFVDYRIAYQTPTPAQPKVTTDNGEVQDDNASTALQIENNEFVMFNPYHNRFLRPNRGACYNLVDAKVYNELSVDMYFNKLGYVEGYYPVLKRDMTTNENGLWVIDTTKEHERFGLSSGSIYEITFKIEALLDDNGNITTDKENGEFEEIDTRCLAITSLDTFILIVKWLNDNGYCGIQGFANGEEYRKPYVTHSDADNINFFYTFTELEDDLEVNYDGYVDCLLDEIPESYCGILEEAKREVELQDDNDTTQPQPASSFDDLMTTTMVEGSKLLQDSQGKEWDAFIDNKKVKREIESLIKDDGFYVTLGVNYKPEPQPATVYEPAVVETLSNDDTTIDPTKCTYNLHIAIGDSPFVMTQIGLTTPQIAEIKRNYDKRIKARVMSKAYHSEPYTPIQEQVEVFENGARLGFRVLGALELA